MLRLGHQARTIAPGGRPRLSYHRQNTRLLRFALLLRAITGGVDTHADTHVAAALDPVGGLLGVQEFPATAAGYARLLGWLGGFGTGVPGRDRGDRQLRRWPGPPRHGGRYPGRGGGPLRPAGPAPAGKSDPLDAVSAARAAQSGRARGAPKGRDGAVEAIRALMVAKRSARGRTHPDDRPGQGPDPDRARGPAGPVRPARPRRPWSPSWRRCGPAPATSSATPPASRCASWDGARSSSTASSSASDELIVPLVTARAPGLLALYGVGPNTAALLLSRGGGPPGAAALRGRLGAPVRAPPRSPPPRARPSRHRLNPGGDRQANHALWRIVFTRMGS